MPIERFGFFFAGERGVFRKQICCLCVFTFKILFAEITPRKLVPWIDNPPLLSPTLTLSRPSLFCIICLSCLAIQSRGMLVKIIKSLVATQAIKMFSASIFYYFVYNTLAIGPSPFSHRHKISQSYPFQSCPSVSAFITLRN